MLIDEIGLLSREDIGKYKFPHIEQEFWLCPEEWGYIDGKTFFANWTFYNAKVHQQISPIESRIRPALIVSNLKAQPGDKVCCLGLTWTVLAINETLKYTVNLKDYPDLSTVKSILFCDSCIGTLKRKADENGDRLMQALCDWVWQQVEKHTVIVAVNYEVEYLFLQKLSKKYNLDNFPTESYKTVHKCLGDNFSFKYSPHLGWQGQTASTFNPSKVFTFKGFCNLYIDEGDD